MALPISLSWETRYGYRMQLAAGDRFFAIFLGMTCPEDLATLITGLGKRVVPRLRESRLPTPSGHVGRVHAT